MSGIPIDIQRQNQLVAFASGALSRGEIELAERVCREMNEAGWGDWRTWLLIAEAACRVRRGDVAIEAIGRAATMPGAAANEIERVRKLADGINPIDAQGNWVHLIRSWGQGFWSDVDHVIGQLLVAEITGRAPIVLWGANTRFGDGAGEQAGNAWELFFEPVSHATIAGTASFFPPKWNAGNLTIAENGAFVGPGSRIAALPFFTRPETVTVSDFHAPVIAVRHWLAREHPLFGKPVDEIYTAMVAKYLKPKAEMIARVDSAAGELGIGGQKGPVIAVHVRGSDKAVEMGDMRPVHAAYHAEISKISQRLGGDVRILLLTDWEPAAAEYRAKYGERLLQTPSTRTEGKIGLHFQKIASGKKLGEDVLFDTLLGARCDAIAGLAYSNVSLFMSYFARLRGLAPDRVALLGPNQHHNYNSFLLRRA